MPPTLHLDSSDPADLSRAAMLLRDGGLVAFATETVYGLGANALSAVAVAGIFAAKKRPSWDPLIVHLASAEQLSRVAEVPAELAERVAALADAFWPGPLTLLLPRSSDVPDAHVLADLDGRIDAVLDAGPTSIGVESTVLDPTQTPMVLYRPGAVTAEQLTAVTGVAVEVFVLASEAQPASMPSPGVGIRHYAPRARLVLVEGTSEALQAAIASEAASVGVLLPQGWLADGEVVVENWGSWDDPEALAAGLFAGLRSLDDSGVSVIVCPLPDAGGIRDAIRDRLQKAARPA